MVSKKFIEKIVHVIDVYAQLSIDNPNNDLYLYKYNINWLQLELYFRYLKYFNIYFDVDNYVIPTYLKSGIRDLYCSSHNVGDKKFANRTERQRYDDSVYMIDKHYNTYSSYYVECHKTINVWKNSL